jgi:hypothetical protein
MSKSLGKTIVMVPTDLGGSAVTTEYVVEYDVEDIVRSRAESQARIVQMVNVGRDTRAQTSESNVLPTIYTDITEDLEDGDI